MNTPTTDYLTAREATDITNDVADLMDDTNVSRSITYRDYQSVSRTITTGAYTTTYTDSEIRGIRTELSAREVRAGEGLYQMGDLRYVLAQSDLSVTPVREDRIVDGTTTYELIAWSADPINVVWTVIARRVK